MSIAALIADLVRAGTDPDLVGRVAEAVSIREPAAVIPARSVSAERQARYRARKEQSVTQNVTNDVIVTQHVTPGSPSPPPSSSFPPIPPLITTPSTPTPPRSQRGREAAELLIEFEGDFWPAYPHKVGKADALRAFGKARGKVDLADMLAALRRYAAKTDDRPWCNPATWLNGERWKDQPAAVQARAGPRSANGFHAMFDSDNNFDGGGYGKPEQSCGIPGGRGCDASDGGTIRPVVEILEPDRANRGSLANR